MSSSSRALDRVEVTFDDETLVADAGLIVPATLMVRLGLEQLVNRTVKLRGRVGGALPGRKVLTLIAAILAVATHIDHADLLRSGDTGKVLPFRVMAPSTLGTFLRGFTFGHIRQLDKAADSALLAVYVNPYDLAAHELLLELYEKAGNQAGAEREKRVIPVLKQWIEARRGDGPAAAGGGEAE